MSIYSQTQSRKLPLKLSAANFGAVVTFQFDWTITTQTVQSEGRWFRCHSSRRSSNHCIDQKYLSCSLLETTCFCTAPFCYVTSVLEPSRKTAQLIFITHHSPRTLSVLQNVNCVEKSMFSKIIPQLHPPLTCCLTSTAVICALGCCLKAVGGRIDA